MNQSQSIPADQIKRSASHRNTRYLYAGATGVLFIIMFIGFHHFYLRGQAYPGRPLTPEIRNLILLHGISTTLWMVLAVVQPLLIAQRRHRLHMKLGLGAIALAALVTVTGIILAINATRLVPPEETFWHITIKQFMAIPISAMILFAGFVTTGVLNRKRREIHRPMMLLATLSIMPAPIDRIGPVLELYYTTAIGNVFGPFFPLIFLGLAFLLVKWALTRSFDTVFATGWVILVVVGAGIMAFAKTPAWDGIAGFLLGH